MTKPSTADVLKRDETTAGKPGKHRLLVVDDDAVCRMTLSAALKKLGREVTLAKDGVEALQLFDAGQHRIIISDLMMPGMDGLELCRRVRCSDDPKYVYFILLTMLEGKANFLEGMKAGADDFITKPFDSEMLAARLAVADRIIDLQSQVRQLAGLLPICSLCKKVRDDQNYWHQVECYVASHSDAQFTHSYCPDCLAQLLKEVEALEAPGRAGA